MQLGNGYLRLYNARLEMVNSWSDFVQFNHFQCYINMQTSLICLFSKWICLQPSYRIHWTGVKGRRIVLVDKYSSWRWAVFTWKYSERASVTSGRGYLFLSSYRLLCNAVMLNFFVKYYVHRNMYWLYGCTCVKKRTTRQSSFKMGWINPFTAFSDENRFTFWKTPLVASISSML